MRKLLILYILILLVSCSRSTRFRLLAPGSTGIGFENRITETDSLNAANYEYIYNGAGFGVADLNNDDLPDIIFAGNQVSTKYYSIPRGGEEESFIGEHAWKLCC